MAITGQIQPSLRDYYRMSIRFPAINRWAIIEASLTGRKNVPTSGFRCLNVEVHTELHRVRAHPQRFDLLVALVFYVTLNQCEREDIAAQ